MTHKNKHLPCASLTLNSNEQGCQISILKSEMR
jgi:hypothetical protein